MLQLHDNQSQYQKKILVGENLGMTENQIVKGIEECEMEMWDDFVLGIVKM